MAAPKSSNYGGWYRNLESGKLEVHYGEGGASDPVKLIELDVAGDLGVVAGTLEVQDGGTETQLSSTTTAVTMNTNSGQITTLTSTLAAAAEEAFTVNNSNVEATDVVIANVASTSSTGTCVVFVTAVASGSFQITKANLHASAAFNNTHVINFVVIKGASS